MYRRISGFLSQNKIISAGFLIVMILTVSVLVVSIQPPKSIVVPSVPTGKAQFVIASWDHPDEYGQGIYLLHFYENSTTAWLPAPIYIDGQPYYTLHHYDSYDYLNWSAGVAMKIRVETYLNQTLVGAESTAEGQNYLRHDVIVTEAGNVVFSQQNFTYYDVVESDPYYYDYEVVLNFLPVSGAVYTVTITYEIYW